jgi:hypothetical protein
VGVSTFGAAFLTVICLCAACACRELTEWKRPGQLTLAFSAALPRASKGSPTRKKQARQTATKKKQQAAARRRKQRQKAARGAAVGDGSAVGAGCRTQVRVRQLAPAPAQGEAAASAAQPDGAAPEAEAESETESESEPESETESEPEPEPEPGLDRKGVVRAAKKLGLAMPAERLARAPFDGTGAVRLEAFIPWVRELLAAEAAEEEQRIREVFDQADLDASGALDAREVSAGGFCQLSAGRFCQLSGAMVVGHNTLSRSHGLLPAVLVVARCRPRAPLMPSLSPPLVGVEPILSS